MIDPSAKKGKRAAYPVYKPSGVEWLGQVPTDWNTSALKYMAHFINGAAFKPSDWQDNGVPIIRIENLNGGEDFNYSRETLPEKYHVRRGDLLFGWSGNRGTSFGPFLWWREGLHYLNQHIFRFANYGCDKKWLYWTLRALTFYVEKQAHGIIGLVHITKGDLGAIKIPVMPSEEQSIIAVFLDHETARIDALIKKKQRQIELLQEKRSALINHAVTKGLDPKARTKASGIDGLGDIPDSWHVLQFRRVIYSLEQGWSPVADDRRAEEDEWAVLKISAVAQGRFRPGEHKALPPSLAPETRYEIRPGDLLVTRSNTPERVGDACCVSETRHHLIMSDLIYRLRLDQRRCLHRFACYWLISCAGRAAIEADARGTSGSMVKIAQSHIRAWPILIPPVEEQSAIVQHIDRELHRLDEIISRVEASIDLLREYRTALISAAVTGKIDVRKEVS